MKGIARGTLEDLQQQLSKNTKKGNELTRYHYLDLAARAKSIINRDRNVTIKKQLSDYQILTKAIYIHLRNIDCFFYNINLSKKPTTK